MAQNNQILAPWKRQDLMLYSSILGTLSSNVQPMVARATTTKEIWTILACTYGKPSRGHIKQIKQELKRSAKGTQSIDEYMTSIIKQADELALLGAPVEHEDLLNIITEGLGDDYRAIVEMANGLDIPITLDELREKLISRELTLTSVGSSSTSNLSARVGSASTHVSLSVMGQDDGEPRVFRMRRDDKIRKLMERYSDARGVECGTYTFVSGEGSRILELNTPDEMELNDGDQIDAMLRHDGGFGPTF